MKTFDELFTELSGIAMKRPEGSGTVRASPTLTAMGMPHEEAIASLRVSFGLSNTADEVDALLPALAEAVSALRSAAVAS